MVSQPTEENLTWHVDSKLNVVPEFNFKEPKGHLFGDGSCYGGTCALTARAGWAVVETTDDGQRLRGKYGVLPKGCQQAASAGEHAAVMAAAEGEAQGRPMGVDCKSLLAGQSRTAKHVSNFFSHCPLQSGKNVGKWIFPCG